MLALENRWDRNRRRKGCDSCPREMCTVTVIEGQMGKAGEEELAELSVGESGFGWGLCSHCFPL